MKNLVLLFFLIQASAFAHADTGLDQLKQTFSTQVQSSTIEFDKAATMKPTVLPLGAEISKQDCDALKAKIAPNYKVNPFKFIYESGSTSNEMCGGQWGWQKNHLQNKSGVTNLGLPYTMVLQLEGRDSNAYRSNVSLYFIDASYRIVEIQGQAVVVKTKEVFSYGITSIDQKGNVYIAVYDRDYGITGGLLKMLVESIEWNDTFLRMDLQFIRC